MAKQLAIIMAGGSGERFWPVSTKTNPKQFLKLSSPTKTLIEESVERAASIVGKENTYIATGKHLQKESCRLTDLPESQVLAEPNKRNTTGCLVWVAANLLVTEEDQEVTLGILTADQKINPLEGFQSTLKKAFQAAEEQNSIVTIGIPPSRPETGFGYIEVGNQSNKVFEVKQFKEKPNAETAKQYLSSGNFLWNSGMFFYTLSTFMKELETAQPEIYEKTIQIAEALKQNNLQKAEEIFDSLPSISIDYAVMEKASKVLVAKAEFNWDDLGAWDSLERSYSPDNAGNVTLGPSKLLESENNIIYNNQENITVNLLGVEDMVVVVTESQVLVCPKDKAQEVKKLLQ